MTRKAPASYPAALEDLDKADLIDERNELESIGMFGDLTKLQRTRLRWIQWQLRRLDLAGR